MNAIALVLVTLSLILLLYALLRPSRRGIGAEELQREIRQRANEPALPSSDGIFSLMQPNTDLQPNEMVTTALTNAADQSRCPACGALITAQDERCPSCEIAFVSDGSPKWTLGTVGPPDGIYRRPTEISE